MKSKTAKFSLCLASMLSLYGIGLVLTSKKLLDNSKQATNFLASFDFPVPDCIPLSGNSPNESTAEKPVSRAVESAGADVLPVPALPKRIFPTKLMTFRRNGGRLNNQWFSLVAAIATAKVLKRTLIIPPEIRPHTRSGMFQPELGWWDLDSLFETYDIVYATEDSDPRLNVTDPTCIADHKVMMADVEAARTKFDHCPNIDIGNQYGLLQCKQHNFCGNSTYQRMAFDVYKHFKPGPVIANILDKLPHYKVAVHSRTHGGAERLARSGLSICHDGLKRTANANYKPPFNMQEVYGQCAFNETLRYLLPNEPFLLAHDGLIDFDTHYGNRAVTVSKALKDAGVIGEPTGMLAAIVELFSVVRADHFYGMIYSTFALSVCMLRGEEKKYDSNVCWAVMHPDSDFAEPPKSDYNRVGCMVPFGPTHTAKYYYYIHATWGKRCDVLRFFPDPTFEAYEEFADKDDVVFLPMMRKMGDQVCSNGQTCRHIWEKIWRMWLWTADNIVDKADYFLKVDTDSFFFPENTRDHVKNMLPEDDLYTGHMLFRRNPPFISGICTLFSRGTIRKLGGVYRTMPTEKDAFESGRCVDRAGATEEGGTSVCLRNLGINATGARDEKHREKFLPFAPHAHLGLKKPENIQNDWFWFGKPPELGDGIDCCSDRPMAIHSFKRVEDLLGLEGTLYGDKTELEVEVSPKDKSYDNYVLQRNYWQQVQQHIDRSKRVIVSSSNQVNAQVFLALCYYMPFDDLVCDPSKAKNRVYQAKFQKPTGEKPKEVMIEAERWAHHRQPWIVDPKDMAGNLEELFPKVRPYKVVIIDEGSNLDDNTKNRFGKGELLVLPKTEFLEKEKCIVAMRTALYHWEVPYSREAAVRACSETQAGQMTTKMLDFLGDEAALISVKK